MDKIIFENTFFFLSKTQFKGQEKNESMQWDDRTDESQTFC